MATSSDTADVLVIGSGASGGALCWMLSKSPGIKVVCLEQGDWFTHPGYNPNAEIDVQRQVLVQRAEPRGIHYFNDGYPYDYSESVWEPTFFNGVGGSTIHWGGLYSRLHPSDFRVHTLDGVASDWPISYRDLEPYYDITDRMMGATGVEGNTSIPPRKPLMPPHGLGRAGMILVQGFENMGWHWWPANSVICTEPYEGGRQPCSNYCYSCTNGCYRKARASADIVYWPEALRKGVTLKTRSRVREVLVDGEGRAEGALYYDAEGRLQLQRARVVVMASNGLGTARLLLNSTSSQFPDGLANSSGLVGKNLMYHRVATVMGQFDEDLDCYKGPGSAALISDEFYESDARRGFVRGHSWIGGRAGITGPVGTAMMSVGESLGGGRGRGGAGPVSIPPMGTWGEGHHQAFQELFNHTLGMTSLGDDLPEESNRAELHPTLTDDMGIPGLKLIVQQGENTRKLMAHSVERMTEVLDASGAKKILFIRTTAGAPGHYLGTARMGDDPNTSVVDRWCRSHDVKNLFVIDGSVFVTSGTVTPTSTIQAIALRTADYLIENSRHLPD